MNDPGQPARRSGPEYNAFTRLPCPEDPVLVMLTLLACDADPEANSPSTPPDPVDSVAPRPEPMDCAPFCVADPSDADIARCYACRCKEAMDGWLPSPEELQCALGEPIVNYTTDAAGTLTPVVDDAATCTNPSLLYGTCSPGGTLGQLTHGDVSVKWICRRYAYRPDYDDPDAPYDDVGAIFYNARTGATCWFDDMDGTGLAGNNWPDLDLTHPEADLAQWTKLFYHTDGEGCIGCHDNDPFIYTPHLSAVKWTSGAWTSGRFRLTELHGGLKRTGARHLVSPEAAPCTSCHRITSNGTCSSWAPDSVGASKGYGHQDLVVEAADDPESPLWHLGTWMPPDSGTDPQAWQDDYGAAVALVTACCRHPGEDKPETAQNKACVWENIP